MEPLSKTKIDRLGDRLRKASITDDDLRLLDEYRRSFTDVYDTVVAAIRNQLGIDPTGRPAKSTTSITEKLRRESIRLTQMQDIAGCRIVISDIAEQEQVVAALVELFRENTVVDRRQKPSHGYRAVHIIVVVEKRAVEIQVRTALQQLWAELSEKISDLLEPAIKYGGGDHKVQGLLIETSAEVGTLEEREAIMLKAQQKLNQLLQAGLTEDRRLGIMELQRKADFLRARLTTERDTVLKAFQDTFRELQE